MPHHRILTAAALVALCSAASAQTRTPASALDFGNDTSAWANDGECDDPRFAGPGASSLNVIVDLMKDATDCQTLYEAGEIWLIAEAPAPVKAPPPAGNAVQAPAGVVFGDDSGGWPGDGECDDRRFFGPGMARSVDTANIGKDATDCGAQFARGQVQLWDPNVARAATQCTAINFGDDSGQWSNDGECDDWRFEGPGTSSIMLMDDIMNDATDCRAACNAGRVFLRDY
ncbi:putative protease ydgD [Ketogulonicigenium robustum]|uniref:Putative protease ydgD n=1 Tax=Ketogulonicigenium robustum TaxID=92947 RepID=A0A1W6NX78_9RHOB|nr:hypothetical protein [Ketogulonicigenium robustum]ARO13753.1 putative protease ydgD [Ketogulonicigenium robustum]